MTTNQTNLKFFSATAIKNLPMWDCGVIPVGGQMFVAKWNDLFVIARNERNFWVVSAEEAKGCIKTVRDEAGKPVLGYRAPKMAPVGAKFEWNVECGTTCPDGCCGDEAPEFKQKCANKEEALALATRMEGKFTSPFTFIRVRGPAFYQFKRRGETGKYGQR
jgi:hypothetical protein